MIYRAVVSAYKTVIMFYHLGRSTETTAAVHDCRRAGRITNNEILLSYRDVRPLYSRVIKE